jgi:DNA-binding PucR family transcriptional regulator
VAPAGLDVPIGDPVLLDLTERPEPAPGAVALPVGIADIHAAVRGAAAIGAAAIVVRGDDDPPADVVAEAQRAGIAVLAAPRTVSWEQLLTLLRAAIADVAGDDRAGGDLFALADALAASLDGPVTIEDPQSRVLAYSTLGHPIDESRRESILGRRVPEHWLRWQRSEGHFQLLNGGGVVVVPGEHELGVRARLAVGVRAGGQVIGSIWVQEGHRPFTDDDQRVLADAAKIAALRLLHHRTAADLDRRRRSEQLRALLDGRAASGLGGLAGFADAASFTVGVVRVEGEDESAAALRVERVADLVALAAESFRRHAATLVADGRVYVLLPDAPVDRAVALLADVVDRAGASLGTGVRAAVGGPVTKLGDLPHSRTEADLALRAAAASERPVVSVDDVRAGTVLALLGDLAAFQPLLTRGRLASLVAQDRERGSGYVETLRAYLDCFGNVPLAAERLHVHRNTFRYRLRRIEELAGIDLTDPDERLVAELQLRWLGRG